MKHIEDYSVGDWVLCTEEGFNKPMQIDCIGRHHITLVNGGKVGGMLSMVGFEPLPITEDILRLIGFYYQKVNETWSIDLGKCNGKPVYVTLWLEDVSSIQLDVNDGKIWHDLYSKFKYVHELQRAFRCMGLNDLANNFRIE